MKNSNSIFYRLVFFIMLALCIIIFLIGQWTLNGAISMGIILICSGIGSIIEYLEAKKKEKE